MTLEKAFQQSKDINIKKDGRKVSLEEIERMSADELRCCEVIILGRPLEIRDNPGCSVFYQWGNASFSCGKKTARTIIEITYQLASLQIERGYKI